MEEQTKFFTYEIASENLKVVKTIKAAVRKLLLGAGDLHKTAVNWEAVRFVEKGAVIPFKSALAPPSAYSWFFRQLKPLLEEAGDSSGLCIFVHAPGL
jgi:hypothetical protein